MYARFVVEKDGSLTDLKIYRSLGEDFDSEVKRLIKSMSRWTPGKQQNKVVRCRMTIPIRFVLS